jgi:predicted ATP-grasp superfamily ATP-dependent carboligase
LRVPFAPEAVYNAASDKVLVHQLASKRGIAIAETVVLEASDSPLPHDPTLYPGVIKPHRSVVGDDLKYRTSVQFVSDRADCARKLAALRPSAFPVLVQRRVYGCGEALFFARWDGRTIARFAHRRLREKPPAGGVSVFSESISADPVLSAACERLLDDLQWEGVAMIEGKRDRETGRWYIMEINGRFWGSLQLAINAGVDFPLILARAGIDGHVEAPPPWKTGQHLRWEWGDLDHLLLRMLRSNARLSLPDDAPSRLQTLVQWCSVLPWKDKLEVFRVRDPMPFVVESARRLGILR